jgi:predicted transcriptional regulator
VTEEIYHLTDEERRLVDEGLAELDRGEVASEVEVRAVFDKYRK